MKTVYGITYCLYPSLEKFNYLNNSTFETRWLAIREIELLKKQQKHYIKIGYGRTRCRFKIREIKLKS